MAIKNKTKRLLANLALWGINLSFLGASIQLNGLKETLIIAGIVSGLIGLFALVVWLLTISELKDEGEEA